MRVVVTDPIVSRLADRFRTLGPEHEWLFVAGDTPEAQNRHLAEADVLVCSHLSADQARMTRAGLVHVTGTGTDRVALAALQPHTRVCRTAHHERSIAEHVLMVILAHERRLLSTVDELRHGTWRTVATDTTTPMHRTINQLTVGFVGLGGICTQALAMLAPLGARCVAVRRDPSATLAPDVARSLEWVRGLDALPELLRAADVVVLGVPLNDSTRNLIGTEALSAMRTDALLINVSRGPVIDEDALHTALVHGQIGGAALDVWWDAPTGTLAPSSLNRFTSLPTVLPTPHASGHAQSTFEGRVDEIVRNIQSYATSGELTSVVRI